MSAAVIKLADIVKTYHTGRVEAVALKGVDLQVREGEFLGVMGPSGSGKSTLLHILGLLDRPSSGTYLLGGQDVQALNDDEQSEVRNLKMGFVFQDFHLLPKETALDNVLLPFTYSRDYPKDARERGLKALEQVGLAERVKHRPGELSGGERQRVALARALVNGPEVIFADEPTGNLDQRASLEVMSILQKLSEAGRTVVLVTHDLQVGRMCRRVLRLVYGRVESDLVNEDQLMAGDLLASLGDNGS